jgi:hypothetical protein
VFSVPSEEKVISEVWIGSKVRRAFLLHVTPRLESPFSVAVSRDEWRNQENCSDEVQYCS